MSENPLSHSPLHERHEALGAKFAAFGGWSMPLEYAGGGVLAEHAAVRQAVGLFDVSHLGKASVTGPGAAAFLNRILTNDLDRVGPGQAQYTLLCNEAGGVVDDLIAYVTSPDEVLLMPNAANTAAVVAVLRESAPAGVEVVGRHRDLAVLAVQGPRSDEVLDDLGLPRPEASMRFAPATLEGAEVTVCRSGYTGERGYELLVPWAVAPLVWDAVLGAGGPYDIRPAGLGARDTLRTEMGYPLHGNDLGPDITPVQARLGWAVGWQKEEFVGRTALRAERQDGPRRLSIGLLALGTGIPRHGMDVVDSGGAVIGEVTSGTFSPTLRKGIALALARPGVAPGTQVGVAIRGRVEPFEVVTPPFVTPHVRG